MAETEELIATIDMREKTGNALIVEEAVALTIEGERYEFFMTNDYATISGKMKSMGYWRPTAYDLKPNPTLNRSVCDKMLELGATWSVTVTDEAGIVSYYDELTDSFFPFAAGPPAWTKTHPPGASCLRHQTRGTNLRRSSGMGPISTSGLTAGCRYSPWPL